MNLLRKFIPLLLAALVAFGASPAFSQATLLPPGEQCFSALTPTSGGPSGTGTGFIGLLGTIAGGSGGTAATYYAALTGGHGSGATANFTVSSGGAITAVAMVNPGVSYVAGDLLSAAPSTIGNVIGFSVPVLSVAINQSLAGGTVAYYVPNTSTPKQTWFNADQASGHQNTNPVTLDANGCAIVYGSGIYRQVLQDALGNIVWDQLTASTNQNNPYWANLAGGTPNAITVTDTGFAGIDGQIIGFIPLSTNTSATTLNPSGFGAYSIVKDTATGAVALTGGEIVASSPSNVVYVSFSAAQQNFHIINLVQAAATATPTQPPQGYLNLLGVANGGPIQGTTDITAATTVYYSPDLGNQIPIWNGSSFSILTFPELQIALSSSAQSSSTIYDACIFNSSGTPIGVFGPAWSNSGAGTGARGTGLGSAQLTYQSGILVNAVSISANNGSNVYSIPALQCTYVGSIFIDATAGQVSAYRTFGQSRKFGLWNAYNRVPIIVQAGDPTANWSYGTNTTRPSNNSTANSITTFVGLPQEFVDTTFSQTIAVPSAHAATIEIGVGWNSTTVFCGTTATIASNSTGSVGDVAQPFIGAAECIAAPSIGINTATSLENINSSGTAEFFGTQPNMVLTAKWRG